MANTLDLAMLAGASYFSTRSNINRFPIPTGWSERLQNRDSDDQTGFEARAFASDDADNRSLIDHLVRHESGVRDPASGTTSIAADQMVTRLTKDLWKLAQDGGMTLTDGIPGAPGLHDLSIALTAFTLQHYYENSANATDSAKQLFSDVTGGIQFDMADVSKGVAAAFADGGKPDLQDAKGFDYAFKQFLAGSTFSATERTLIQAVLPYMRDWYVQAGTSGLANTDILNRGAFMLGGNGSDALVGGSAADLLVGNAGDDVLMGGTGNDTLLGGLGNDTYVFQSGDGLDTILDSDGKGSILHDGDTLAGGVEYGDTRVYKSADNKHLYVLAGDKTLIVDGQIVVQGYDKGRADLGITYSNAAVVNNPDTSKDIKGDLKPKDTNPAVEGTIRNKTKTVITEKVDELLNGKKLLERVEKFSSRYRDYRAGEAVQKTIAKLADSIR